MASVQYRKILEFQKCLKILDDHWSEELSYASQFIYSHPSIHVVHDPYKGRCLRTTKPIKAGTILLTSPSATHYDLSSHSQHAQINVELAVDLFCKITAYGSSLDKAKVLTDTLHPQEQQQQQKTAQKGQQSEPREYPLEDVNPVPPQFLYPNFPQSEALPNPLIQELEGGKKEHLPVLLPKNAPQPLLDSLITTLKNPVGYSILRRCYGIAKHNSILYPGDAPFIIPPLAKVKQVAQKQQNNAKKTTKFSKGKKPHKHVKQNNTKQTQQNEQQLDDNDVTIDDNEIDSILASEPSKTKFDRVNMFSILRDTYNIQQDDISACHLRSAPLAEPGYNGLAVFPTFSLLNHSCTPNATPIFFNIPSPEVVQSVHEYSKQCVRDAYRQHHTGGGEDKGEDEDEMDYSYDSDEDRISTDSIEIIFPPRRKPSSKGLADKMSALNVEPTQHEDFEGTHTHPQHSGDDDNDEDEDDGEIVMKEGSLAINIPKEDSVGVLAVCCAIDDIPAGTEICINYIPLADPSVSTIESMDGTVISYVPWIYEFRLKLLEQLHGVVCVTERCELAISLCKIFASSQQVPPPKIQLPSSFVPCSTFKQVMAKFPVDMISRELIINTVVKTNEKSKLNTKLLPLFISCHRESGKVREGGIGGHPKDYLAALKATYDNPIWQSIFVNHQSPFDINNSSLSLTDIFCPSISLLSAVSSALSNEGNGKAIDPKTTSIDGYLQAVIPSLPHTKTSSPIKYDTIAPAIVSTSTYGVYTNTLGALRQFEGFNEGPLAFARVFVEMEEIDRTTVDEPNVSIINLSEKTTTQSSDNIRLELLKAPRFRELITLVENLLVDVLGITDPVEVEKNRIEDMKNHLKAERQKYRKRLYIDYIQRQQKLRDELKDPTAQLTEPDYEEELRKFDRENAKYDTEPNKVRPRSWYLPMTHWLLYIFFRQLTLLYSAVGAHPQALASAIFVVMMAGLSVPLPKREYLAPELSKLSTEEVTPSIDWGYTMNNFKDVDGKKHIISQGCKPSIGTIVKAVHPTFISSLSDIIDILKSVHTQVLTAVEWAAEESSDDIDWLISFEEQILFLGKSIERITF